MPESIRPPTRRGRHDGVRPSQDRDAVQQETHAESGVSDQPQLNGGENVNQTGAIETVFVPAFIVQRQAESSQVAETENNQSVTQAENNPNILPFDLDFDQNHEGKLIDQVRYSSPHV